MLNLSAKPKTQNLFKLFYNIESTSSRTVKKELLATANEEQRNLIWLALNPYIQFHITDWNANLTGDITDQEAYDGFLELLEYCKTNNYSGELVRKVEQFFSSCNSEQKEWLGRVISKDLRFGLLEKSVNEVFGKDFVPTCDVMLAFPSEKDLSNVRFLNRPKDIIIERKYDGFRCLVFYRNGLTEVIGRSGKPITNRLFMSMMEEYNDNLQGMVLDGEAYCEGLTFEELSSYLRTADATLPAGFKLYMFDVMTVDEWNAQKCVKKYMFRCIERDLIASTRSCLYSIPRWTIEVGDDTFDRIDKLYQQFLDEGFEGGMLKDAQGYYEWKRSNNEMKLKPSEKIDAVIYGYEESDKMPGCLGAFKCHLEDGTEIQVGGGYKKRQRIEFWANPNQYVGQWIHVKYTMKTASGALRHPVFKGFRDKK